MPIELCLLQHRNNTCVFGILLLSNTNAHLTRAGTNIRGERLEIHKLSCMNVSFLTKEHFNSCLTRKGAKFLDCEVPEVCISQNY